MSDEKSQAGDGAGHDSGEPIRQAARPVLPKRFYKEVTIVREGALHVLTLDGRRAKTPAGHSLELSSATMATALAAEWDAQETEIDPAKMPVTRIANSAIDRVKPEMAAVRADIVRYAGSDLLCYRADSQDQLGERQETIWGPILTWAQEVLGSKFHLAAGIVAVEQPPTIAIAFEQQLAPLSALQLAGVHTVTSLTGSAVLALALLKGRLTADQTWEAAHLDEDWQMENWGRDEVALSLRAGRRGEFDAALLALVDG